MEEARNLMVYTNRSLKGRDAEIANRKAGLSIYKMMHVDLCM